MPWEPRTRGETLLPSREKVKEEEEEGGGFLPLASGGAGFFFNDTATTEIYTLSLHDALPIWERVPFFLFFVGLLPIWEKGFPSGPWLPWRGRGEIGRAHV